MCENTPQGVFFPVYHAGVLPAILSQRENFLCVSPARRVLRQRKKRKVLSKEKKERDFLRMYVERRWCKVSSLSYGQLAVYTQRKQRTYTPLSIHHGWVCNVHTTPHTHVLHTWKQKCRVWNSVHTHSTSNQLKRIFLSLFAQLFLFLSGPVIFPANQHPSPFGPTTHLRADIPAYLHKTFGFLPACVFFLRKKYPLCMKKIPPVS